MQNGQHIRSAFDKALEGIQANMLKMGGLVEANIISAAKALEERDVELAEKVRERAGVRLRLLRCDLWLGQYG